MNGCPKIIACLLVLTAIAWPFIAYYGLYAKMETARNARFSLVKVKCRNYTLRTETSSGGIILIATVNTTWPPCSIEQRDASGNIDTLQLYIREHLAFGMWVESVRDMETGLCRDGMPEPVGVGWLLSSIGAYPLLAACFFWLLGDKTQHDPPYEE